MQAVFTGWSDGGALSHAVTVPAGSTAYTAGFATRYQLTTAVNLAAGGHVLPLTGGWYGAGSLVQVSVTPNAGYAFANWTGAVANAAAAATSVTMSAPQSLVANLSGVPALRAQVTGKTGAAASRVWTITLTNSGTGTATEVAITGLAVAAWSGTPCTPAVQTTGPVAVPDVAPGSPRTASLTIDFGTCAAATKFKVDIGYRFGPGGGTVGTTSYTNTLR